MREAGNAVGSQAEACDFRHLVPCPAPLQASVPTSLADGVHALTVAATDAAGNIGTATATLKLDTKAPTAPVGLSVSRSGGSFVYTWTNPDTTGTAPIAAAHLSDGTVVKGDNLQTLPRAVAI